MTQMHRRNRKWVPDSATIADQLIADYCDATQQNPNDPLEARGQVDLDAIGTMKSREESAEFHGEGFTEDDWLALVHELARRAAARSADTPAESHNRHASTSYIGGSGQPAWESLNFDGFGNSLYASSRVLRIGSD